MTAPTQGFGEARPVPLAASSRARRRNFSSVWRSDMAGGRRTLRKKRIYKIFGVERQQVACFFTYAHVSYRKPQLARNRHHDASFGSAIEFGEYNAGYPGGLRKQARLL